MYSVGNAAGTVNIHQFTDLIIRTYYKVQGTTVDVAFANPTAANNAPPSAAIVKTISAVVKEIIGLWLTNNGINSSTFDLITTPFTAGNATTPATGFDTVLASSTVNTASGVVAITVGTTTQTTTVAVDAATHTTTATTSVAVNGTVTSTSFTSTVVAADAATQAAVTGVLATLSNLSTTINTKGSALAGADLLPYYDAAYIDSGLTGTQDAARFAADVAGATFSAFTVDRVLKFDTVNNIISIAGIATITQKGVTATQSVNGNGGDGLIFKKQANGSWLMYGNQERARVNQVNVTTDRNRSGLTGTGGDGVYYLLKIEVNAPVGAITSATVSGLIGGANLQNVPLTKSITTFTNNGVLSDGFFLADSVNTQYFYNLSSPAAFPPAGSVYTYVVNFSNGSQQTYTRVLGAATSEAFDLQAGVEATIGHSAATALNKPITLSWNLPTTFSISEVNAYGFVKNLAGVGCNINGPQLATNATTVTITLPTTCVGAAVDTSNTNGASSISINVVGSGGQHSGIWYAFQLP